MRAPFLSSFLVSLFDAGGRSYHLLLIRSQSNPPGRVRLEKGSKVPQTNLPFLVIPAALHGFILTISLWTVKARSNLQNGKKNQQLLVSLLLAEAFPLAADFFFDEVPVAAHLDEAVGQRQISARLWLPA